MVFSKIHFHGVNTGIGDYARTLDAAGIPISTVSLANAGWAAEVAAMRRASGVPHQIVIRWPETGARGDDLPLDHLLDSDPQEAAGELYSDLRPILEGATELHEYKDIIYVQPTNEVSTLDHDPFKVGRFMAELAALLNLDGWRAAIGAWNAGQPEREDWHTGGMRELLGYLQLNPQNVMVFHEGKTAAGASPEDPIEEFVPHMVGRFRWMLEEARAQGFRPPNVIITEWAWAFNDMPDHEQAMADVRWLAEDLARTPEAKGCCLWNLERGQGSLPDKLLALMPAVQTYNLEVRFPDSEPAETDEQRWWRMSVEEQIEHGLQLAPTALQDAIGADNMHPVHKEAYWPGEPPMMAAEDWANRGSPDQRPRRLYVYENGQVRWFEDPEMDEPEPAPPPSGDVTFPVGTAAERAAAVDDWPGDWFDANPFGNYYHVRDGHYAYHTGADLNLNQPAWDSDRGKPVLAMAAGEVTYADRFNSAWGNIIVIRHAGFYSRCSAVDELRVTAGDTVAAGEQIAVVGQHGAGEPFHLHFDISPTERLGENPGDWPGTDLDRLHRDYVPPLPFILERLEAEPDPVGIDLLPYLRGDGRAYMVQHSSGAAEKFRTVRRDPWFLQVKNAQWEELRADDDWIYRRRDTSPGPAPEYAERPGAMRFYTQDEGDGQGTRWAPRRMTIGQAWEGPGHHVQFFYKDTCEESAANSGSATNRTTLKAHHDSVTFNGITVEDVIELGGGEESFYYARDYGLIAWASPWGESAISETGVEADNEPEALNC